MSEQFDRAAIGAQALAMTQAQNEPQEADASTETEADSTEEAADDEPAESEAAEADDSDAGEDGDEDESGEGSEGGIDAEAAKEAAIAGDTAALAKALGLDARALDTSGRKLKFVRKTLQEAKALKASTEQVQSDLRSVYGDVHEAATKLRAGDWSAAVECYEKTFGSFEDLVTKVLGERSSEGSAELSQRERRIKEREEAFEASRRKLEADSRAANEEAAAVSRVKTALKGHAYVKDADDAREVVKLVVSSAGSDGKPTLSAKQAADKLLEQARKKAEKLGIVAGKPKPKPKAAKKPVKLSKASQPDRKLKLTETLSDIFPDEERKRLIAEARRLSGVK